MHRLTLTEKFRISDTPTAKQRLDLPLNGPAFKTRVEDTDTSLVIKHRADIKYLAKSVHEVERRSLYV